MKKYTLLSAVFIMTLGTLLHFTYEWSGCNPLVAGFSAVNESVWEHLKLLFFPSLLTAIAGALLFKKKYPGFLCAKTKGILAGCLFIIVFFYTYTGILGFNVSVLDVGSFFAAVILEEYVSAKMAKRCPSFPAALVLAILSLCFVVFTYFPPEIGLFMSYA